MKRRALERTPTREVHAVDDRHFVAILKVLSDAGQIDARPDAVASRVACGPMPDSISSCGVLNAPPARITSRRRKRLAASRRAARSGAGSAPYRCVALQVLDADGALLIVEQRRASPARPSRSSTDPDSAARRRARARACRRADDSASSAACSAGRPRSSRDDAPVVRDRAWLSNRAPVCRSDRRLPRTRRGSTAESMTSCAGRDRVNAASGIAFSV